MLNVLDSELINIQIFTNDETGILELLAISKKGF